MTKELTLFFFISIYMSFGQNLQPKPDTFEISKSKKGYYYFISDSIPVNNTFGVYGYIKYFDKKHRLVLEGLGRADRTIRIDGDIKYYYKTGQLSRIEHYGFNQWDTTCKEHPVLVNIERGPEGTWKFFSRNGSIKKQFDYYIRVNSCDPIDYCVIKEIKLFDRSGKVKKMRQKKISCWRDTK